MQVAKKRVLFSFTVVLAIVLSGIVGYSAWCKIGLEKNIRQQALAHFDSAIRLASMNKYVEAEQELLVVLRLMPSFDLARDNLDIYRKRSNPYAWLTEHPEDDSLRFDLFTKCLRDGGYEDAVSQTGLFVNADMKNTAVNNLINWQLGFKTNVFTQAERLSLEQRLASCPDQEADGFRWSIILDDMARGNFVNAELSISKIKRAELRQELSGMLRYLRSERGDVSGHRDKEQGEN